MSYQTKGNNVKWVITREFQNRLRVEKSMRYRD